MKIIEHSHANRVLVVDDDALIVDEYIRCLSGDFDDDVAATTISDLEKVLFGEETDERGAARFDVDKSRRPPAEDVIVLRGCDAGDATGHCREA